MITAARIRSPNVTQVESAPSEKKVSLEEIFLELTEDDKKKKNEKETDKKEGENK